MSTTPSSPSPTTTNIFQQINQSLRTLYPALSNAIGQAVKNSVISVSASTAKTLCVLIIISQCLDTLIAYGALPEYLDLSPYAVLCASP